MRTRIQHALTVAAAVAALLAGALPAQAASSTSLSISESFATSVGSVSDSFRGSSRSSAGERRLAAGEFRIVEVAAADRAGRVQLKLQPTDAHNTAGFTLELPEGTLARTPLAVGDTIAATPRPFGVEFALAATREAFFLVLDDDWYRELAAKRLV